MGGWGDLKNFGVVREEDYWLCSRYFDADRELAS